MESVSKLTDVLTKLPKPTDENEVRIVRLIQQELLQTEWARQTFATIRQHLIHYFKYAIDHLTEPTIIHQATQHTLREIARVSQAKIVDGEKNLDSIPKRSPILAAVNHLGSYKVTEIQPSELGIKLPIDVIHPFPIYYTPLVPIGQILEDDLFEAHVELPQPLYQIQQAAGLIIVPPDPQGILFNLQRQTRNLITRYPNALITVFPEGGTSGKRNGGGPYDLEEFKTGAFVIAAHLHIPVLPVCQYFNPHSGFEVGILPPIHPQNTDNRDYFQQLAEQTRIAMQNWLKQRQSVATAGIEPAT